MPLQVSRRGPRLEPTRRRWLLSGLALGAVAVAGWLAVPRRFAVDGVSMGPGLLPGDVVRTGPCPALDRLRRPRRFDRWVLAAADGLALKRVVGLPGEEVALVDGDLAIDGEIVLKGPRSLAELGCRVAGAAGDAPPAGPDWAWSCPAGEILDDAAFDTGGTRVLTTVRDVGFAAVADVPSASAADPAEIRLRVGGAVMDLPLAEPGRHAVVAGRLDGRLVVATWRVPENGGSTEGRGCLPAGAPEAWRVADPWPQPDGDDPAPALAIGGDRAIVVTASRWRDVAWLPGADGRSRWCLGAAEVFVLGDHPPASTDSRRWGPIPAVTLRHRIVALAGR